MKDFKSTSNCSKRYQPYPNKAESNFDYSNSAVAFYNSNSPSNDSNSIFMDNQRQLRGVKAENVPSYHFDAEV